VSDNTAVLVTLVVLVSWAFIIWVERPRRLPRRGNTCDTHGHPARLRDPQRDNQAST
jgi:hypothetical protein